MAGQSGEFSVVSVSYETKHKESSNNLGKIRNTFQLKIRDSKIQTTLLTLTNPVCKKTVRENLPSLRPALAGSSCPTLEQNNLDICYPPQFRHSLCIALDLVFVVLVTWEWPLKEFKSRTFLFLENPEGQGLNCY